MILFIAEKPSVMKNIIDANLEGVSPKRNQGYAIGKNMIYTHAIGHLLTLAYPKDIDDKYKVWNLDNLPFHFENIPLTVNESTKKQLEIVSEILKRNDITEVINACDADREGDLIFRNLYHYSKPFCKNVSRIWLDSQTADGIKDAFRARRKESDYNNIYFAGKARSYADYIIGLNATMAMTTKLKMANDVFSVGRVQTPTLRIIVDLEREIKAFKSTPFYKITADGNLNGTNLVGNYINDKLDNNRFLVKADALDMIKKIGLGEALITDLVKTKKYEKPKMLYSLSDLQIDMDKRYSMSPIDVLNTAQRLYEVHKLITYPRTDENHISDSLAKKTGYIVNNLCVCEDTKREIIKNKYQINKMMIAKKDIGAHEAITPTSIKTTKDYISKLNSYEIKVYMAICERFLAAFLPDAEIEKQKLEFKKNDETFQTEIEICVFEGHRSAYKYGRKEKENSKTFIETKVGDKVNILALNLVEGKTNPPARFTEGSLVKMMKNPVKYVSDNKEKDILKKVEGIGTEATRAGIIQELKNRSLIALDDKKCIYPTKKGIGLIDSIPSEDVKSVSLTAMFETKLDLISKGEYSYKDFLDEIYKLTDKFILDIKNMGDVSNFNYVCKCPICGADVLEREKSYSCSNKDCDVFIFKNALGAKLITSTQAKNLLTLGSSVTKVLCRSKQNNDFEALMTYKYDKEEKYHNVLSFDFSKDAESEEETLSLKEESKPICKCPICKSDIIESAKSYHCTNKECRVSIYKTARGCKKITKKAAVELFTKGITSTKLKCIDQNKNEIEVRLNYKYNGDERYPNQIDYVYDK